MKSHHSAEDTSKGARHNKSHHSAEDARHNKSHHSAEDTSKDARHNKSHHSAEDTSKDTRHMKSHHSAEDTSKDNAKTNSKTLKKKAEIRTDCGGLVDCKVKPGYLDPIATANSSARSGNARTSRCSFNAGIKPKVSFDARRSFRISKRHRRITYPQNFERNQEDCTKKQKSGFSGLVKVLVSMSAKTQRKNDFARAMTTNLVCLLFVLMWVPKSTIDLLQGLGLCENCHLGHVISALLAWTNSGINALIYAWRMRDFREAIRKMLSLRKKKH